MFDLPLPIHPTAHARGVPPHFPSGDTDPSYPFALTLSRRAPADLMSGRAARLVVARFATLAEAMQGAIDHAEGIAPGAAPQILAILERDARLVLAGAASDSAVAWRRPVTSAAEARGVATEASQRRAQADRVAGWGERPIWRSGCATAPIFWMHVSSIRSGAPSPPERCGSPPEARETERGRGDLEPVRGREIARLRSLPLPPTPSEPIPVRLGLKCGGFATPALKSEAI